MNAPQLNNNQTNPTISVVLPAFNAEKYVREAVQSVFAQSFTNFELIIINDGSTDGTLAILEELREQDRRIIIVSRENKGLVQSLNEGLDLARGPWIARMDADDIALPHRFERQLQWLELTGADMCGSWIKLFGASDKRIVKLPQTDEAIKMWLLFAAAFAHPTVMMRAKLIKKIRYDKVWEKCEDYDLWERAVRAGWIMTNVPEVLLLYRQHESQTSSRSSAYQQMLSQKIRRRLWQFRFDSFKLQKEWIDEVLKLREPSLTNPNMDYVDTVFIELLQRNHGETRATILEHATRLYFRAASTCPDIVARWSKLNRSYGTRWEANTKIKLWLLRVFRIHSSSSSFGLLKSLYLKFIRTR